MKVGIAQISSSLGDMEKNLKLHEEYIQKAIREKNELIIFPELSLSGYSLQDLVEQAAVDPNNHPIFQRLKQLSENISIIVGFVEEKEKGMYYNSAACLSRGEIIHIHRKVFLPTYGMFEEAKFFSEGKNFNVFPTPLGMSGMMICYDFLHYGACYLLMAGKADMIIVLSAAPGRGAAGGDQFESSYMWELMGETISRFSTAFVIYCNRVGIEDGKTFAGGSFIFNPGGKLLAKAAYIDEDFISVDLQEKDLRDARKFLHYRRDTKPEIILEALDRIVHNYED
jgi:predicted amidohydrolase